jgi:hypothetical protein
MRRFYFFAASSLLALPFFGCGDSGTTTGGGASGPGATSTTSGTGGGGVTGSGDCDSDADCNGGTCVALTPGGFRVCKMPIVEATMCQNQGSGGASGTGGAGGAGGAGGGSTAPADECCTSDDCGGRCVLSPLIPQCGGPSEIPHNVCTDQQNQCDNAQDCDGNLCVDPGTIGNKVRQCLPTKCGTDAECTAEAGGLCELVFGCCDLAVGLYCVYPTGGCRRDSDCGAGNYCQVQGNDAKCVPGSATCPQ